MLRVITQPRPTSSPEGRNHMSQGNGHGGGSESPTPTHNPVDSVSGKLWMQSWPHVQGYVTRLGALWRAAHPKHCVTDWILTDHAHRLMKSREVEMGSCGQL